MASKAALESAKQTERVRSNSLSAMEMLVEWGSERAAERAVAERVVETTAECALASAERAMESAAERVVAKTAERAMESAAERVVEKTAERALESAAERVVETTSERAVESALEHLGETAGKVLLERSAHIGAEKVGERMVEHGVETVGERLLEETVAHTFAGNATAAAPKVASSWVSHTSSFLKALRVGVPFVGTFLVLHMCHEDWHRATHEWHEKRKLTTAFFGLAAVCDFLDVLVHVLVLLSLTAVSVDHHVIHDAERFGMGAACVAIFSMITGEVLCIRRLRRAAAPTVT